MSLLDKASIIITPNGVKATKLYAYKPSNGNGDMTWSRATTATRVNSIGVIETSAVDVPRINYPLNGGCPSVKGESQRTNLIIESEDFVSGAWVKTGATVTPNATISPDGFNNGTLFETTNTLDRVARVQTNAIGEYVFSFYVRAKSGESGTWSWSYLVAGGTTQVMFTPIDDTKWYRVYVNIIRTTLGNIVVYPCYKHISSDLSDAYIWGAQLELGTYPTTIIQTNGTAVTRLKDTGSRNGVYSGGFITANGGSWFVELTDNTVKTRDAIGGGLTLDTNNGGKNNGLEISNTVGTSRFSLSKYVATVLSTLYTTTTDHCKVLFNWDGVVLNVYENGVQVVTNEPFTITAMEFLQLNCIDQPYNFKQNILGEPFTNEEAIQITTI